MSTDATGGAGGDAECLLAIDIGGTKMAAGIVTAAGSILDRRQRPTAVTDTADDLFADLVALIDELSWRSAGVVACGVGCGGPMTLGGEAVSPVNIPAWRGFRLRARLAEVTELPVFVDNDAKALALGEGWKGAAVGVSDYIGMVVSTGVGGGIVLCMTQLNLMEIWLKTYSQIQFVYGNSNTSTGRPLGTVLGTRRCKRSGVARGSSRPSRTKARSWSNSRSHRPNFSRANRTARRLAWPIS